MRTCRFALRGGAQSVEEGEVTNADMVEAWGILTWRWRLEQGAPVEGVVVEWEIDGDDAHLTVLMTDDHAERFAVSPESGDAEWDVP